MSIRLRPVLVPPPAALTEVPLTLAAVAPGAAEWMDDAVRLTARELQVIELAGRGRTNQEIAVQLQIPMHTVRGHMQNLLEKLALRGRIDVDVAEIPRLALMR